MGAAVALAGAVLALTLIGRHRAPTEVPGAVDAGQATAAGERAEGRLVSESA
jgi:hypothetical protein